MLKDLVVNTDTSTLLDPDGWHRSSELRARTPGASRRIGRGSEAGEAVESAASRRVGAAGVRLCGRRDGRVLREKRLQKEGSNVALDLDAVKPKQSLSVTFSKRYTSLRLRRPATPLHDRLRAASSSGCLRKSGPVLVRQGTPYRRATAVSDGGNAIHLLAQVESPGLGAGRVRSKR